MNEAEIVPLTQALQEVVSVVSSTEQPVVSLDESLASQSQKEQLAALLTEYRGIFNMSRDVAGKCTLI